MPVSTKKKTSTKRQTVYAKTTRNSPSFGMNRVRFYYVTEVDAKPWLADIDEEVMREPKTFKINPEPFGFGFPDKAKLQEFLKRSDCSFGEARSVMKPVGFIERGKLYITKRIRIETGWGWAGYGMAAIRFSTIYPNAARLVKK